MYGTSKEVRNWQKSTLLTPVQLEGCTSYSQMGRDTTKLSMDVAQLLVFKLAGTERERKGDSILIYFKFSVQMNFKIEQDANLRHTVLPCLKQASTNKKLKTPKAKAGLENDSSNYVQVARGSSPKIGTLFGQPDKSCQIDQSVVKQEAKSHPQQTGLSLHNNML